MSADPPVIHVIDDDDAVRESIAFLLGTADLPTRTYASAVEFLDQQERAAGCIVTDVRMPVMNGLELVRRLNESGSTDPVIVLTGHADVPLAVEAMKAGVFDFIEKPFDDEVLLDAIRSALARPRPAPGKAARTAEDRDRAIARLEGLSTREREVLDGLVAGRANKVIAFDLGISARTVEVYRANVMTKTGANSLSELVRLAILADAD